MPTNIKWRDKEIRNPILRAIAYALALPIVGVCILFAFVWIIAAMVLLVVVAVLSLPLHFALILFGRRGFVVRRGPSISYDVSLNGFRKEI